jgi:cysteine synthase B
MCPADYSEIPAPGVTPGLSAARILESVGNTPLLELGNISRETTPVRIFGKAEWCNPGGSVKDRPALNMIREGIQSGRLGPDKTILDATSGNTGIAYAMIGAALGYPVQLCIPRNVSDLHKRILRAYGADLVFTDPTLGSDGAILEARKLTNENPTRYFYPDQYSNDANWRAHYGGTGPEIIEQTGGAITHFVAGLGTTGTFTGTGRFLKESNPDIRLISFQPFSPFHGLEGLKHLPTSIVPEIYDDALSDEELTVETEDAQAMVRRLAREEGLLVGPSAGAAAAAALEIAKGLKDGVVVTILCDSGHKYLGFDFWDEAPE